MESHTRALVRESPQDEQAGWAVVYALWNQAKYQQAWGFIVGHDLQPFNEQTARLMIAVCADTDSPDDTAGPLLEIAGIYTDSEVVAGSAIAVVMARGDRVRLTDAQREQLNELTQDFVERFPDSAILRAYSFAGPEEVLAVMGELSRARALEYGALSVSTARSIWEHAAKVRLGVGGADAVRDSAAQQTVSHRRCGR